MALVLGSIGAVVSVLAAVAVVWLGLAVGRAVDTTLDWTTRAVDRLDSRLTETATAVTEVDELGEIRARMARLADVASGARESLAAVTDHPLYGRLPVGMSRVDDGLSAIESSAQSLEETLEETVGGQLADEVRTSIVSELEEARTRYIDVETAIEDLAASLKRWTRLVAFGGVLLALWSLWAQVVLARIGHQWRSVRGRVRPDP